MFASAGDNGSEGCGTNALAVDDPASQPFVTGVGGTSLHLDSFNTYLSEGVWNRFSQSGGAGGGGVSIAWSKPAYQTGPGTANSFSNGHRQVPDVSANADPYTGYTVYVHDTQYCPGLTG